MQAGKNVKGGGGGTCFRNYQKINFTEFYSLT